MHSAHLKYILAFLSCFACCIADAQIITDHHTHIQDSALVKCFWKLSEQWHETPTAGDSVLLDADSLITEMDKAHITNAVILSCAYMFGAPGLNMNDEYELVKKENDWVAQQAALYPQRLKAYLGVNPLKDYAPDEIKRCALTGKFAGLKLHFTNSEIDIRDTNHIKKLQAVFMLADSLGLPITVHMRTLNDDYGATDAGIFINNVLVHVTHTRVQVAHMCGWGGYDKPTDAALQVFIDSFKKAIISRSNIYFDISAVIPQAGETWAMEVGDTGKQKKSHWNAKAALIKKIRAIGTSNILFGSDWPGINMKAYIQTLENNLGSSTGEAILKN